MSSVMHVSFLFLCYNNIKCVVPSQGIEEVAMKRLSYREYRSNIQVQYKQTNGIKSLSQQHL